MREILYTVSIIIELLSEFLSLDTNKAESFTKKP